MNTEISNSGYALPVVSTSNVYSEKSFLDDFEKRKRVLDAQYMVTLNDKLRRMYTELRLYAPRWIDAMGSITNFDPKLFPKDLINVVEHLASHAEIDTASVLLATIGSLSSAMCGRYIIQLDPQWRESGCLYSVIAAPPGFRKSFVMGTLEEPYDEYFGDLNAEYEAQSAEFEKNRAHVALLKRKLTHAIIGKHLKDSFEDGIYSGDPSEALDDLQHTIDNLDRHVNMTKPKNSLAPQIFLSIASRVSAGAIMSKQGEYACVFEAEGCFFEGELTDKSTHPGLYLKAFGMERYEYSSIKVGKVAMRRPAMCITAFVQPDVLKKFYSNTNLQARGLNARFLPLFASKLNTFGQSRLLPAPPKFRAMAIYNSKITEMLKRNFTQDKNREIWTVSVTPEAYNALKNCEQTGKGLVSDPKYKHMSAFISKAHGAIARLAMSIHAWNNPMPELCPITLDEVEAAISLMNVIFEHANIAFAPERSQACVDAQGILDWVHRCDWTHSPTFTDRDVMAAISGLNKKQCHAALDLLEQHDYIRQHIEAVQGRICILNPQLVERNLPPMSVIHGHF